MGRSIKVCPNCRTEYQTPSESVCSKCGTNLILEKVESEMLDLRDLPYLEIQVSKDGKTVWLNTAEECIVRIQNIDKLILNDQR